MPGSTFIVKPVTKATWGDFAALFEGKGGPKYCWCNAWRPMERRGTADNAARKQAMRERVLKRVPIGLLGYLDGEPVGWCSVAPRETFLKLSAEQDDSETGVWSVTCFFVRRDHREIGLSGKLQILCAHCDSVAGATLAADVIGQSITMTRIIGTNPEGRLRSVRRSRGRLRELKGSSV